MRARLSIKYLAGECVCVGVFEVGRTERVCSSIPLRLELQTKANLMAASIDVLAIEESRQGQLDSCRNTRVRISTPVIPSTRFWFKTSNYRISSNPEN